MKVISETNLSEFNFWSGALDRAKMLSKSQLDLIGEQLEEMYPEGLSETTINDMFWFEFTEMCALIGLEYCEQCDNLECTCEEEETA